MLELNPEIEPKLTSTGTNKMRKTNALDFKTQRLIAETHLGTHRNTHRDTQRDTQRHRDIERYTHSHRNTHIETHTQRHTDTNKLRHIQRAASKIYPSFCYTHES